MCTKSTTPPPRDPVLKWILITLTVLLLLTAAGVGILVWKFSPILKVDKEAQHVTLLGGLVGTALGYAAIQGFSSLLSWELSLEFDSLALALGVSTAIGLVFGFFPARRAARMDPVQALGRE